MRPFASSLRLLDLMTESFCLSGYPRSCGRGGGDRGTGANLFKPKQLRRSRTNLQRPAKEYPAVRIDVAPMSDIEADERKAIGEDMAKDFAPLIGKTGIEFE